MRLLPLAWRDGLLVACSAALLLSASLTRAVEDQPPARDAFNKVLSAQASGKHQLAAKLARGLEAYPLYPYYQYRDLERRLGKIKGEEIADFLTAQEPSYLASRLRRQWLSKLAKEKRWTDFLAFYQPGDNLELHCLHLQARLAVAKDPEVMNDIRAVWLSAKSLPESCDPAFKQLYASALMTDELVWSRIQLAMAAGKTGLANYLSRRLTSRQLKFKTTLWLEAHRQPGQVLARNDLADEPDIRMIAVHAVGRLARGSVEQAERAWSKLAGTYAFSELEHGQVAAMIALAAAKADHPRRLALLDAVPASAMTATLERYRMREALLAQAWHELERWTAQSSKGGVYTLRWNYWRARALRQLGQAEAAVPILESLAKERDYYGFLAADLLGQAYQLNHQVVNASQRERDAFKAIPGISRAREFYLLDQKTQSRREWYFELAQLDTRGLEIAAAVAGEWQWPDSAISALGKAKSYDDLDLRFPLLYVEEVKKYASKRQIAAARILAIIRSESAFVVDARSPVGAYGLMQLMPATAQETAKRVGLKPGKTADLKRPDRNIALGSAYLAQMLKRYGGNFAMASAAYNAGPHRVRQWRKSDCIEADIWIDTIPFTETRRYVRRAYFYTALYESRMGEEIIKLSTVMPRIPAKQSNQLADCT